MARLIVITDPDTALGFRLAGVDVDEAPTPGAGGELLLSRLRAREAEIVVYNEEYATALPEKTRAALEDSLVPVFFAIPVAQARRAGEPREQYLARLLRRAIGDQLKIKR
jgi:V/A-type H+-transporting ATPase subunit F